MLVYVSDPYHHFSMVLFAIGKLIVIIKSDDLRVSIVVFSWTTQNCQYISVKAIRENAYIVLFS